MSNKIVNDLWKWHTTYDIEKSKHKLYNFMLASKIHSLILSLSLIFKTFWQYFLSAWIYWNSTLLSGHPLRQHPPKIKLMQWWSPRPFLCACLLYQRDYYHQTWRSDKLCVCLTEKICLKKAPTKRRCSFQNGLC